LTLSLTQSITAVGPLIPASFLGIGGVGPYFYEVLAGGAGGTINSSTGVYTAPASFSMDPKKNYDTVKVTDSTTATATAQILVGSPLLLFCDIIQKELSLANGRVYLWDQKIMQPTDSDLYVAVSVPRCKPFSNVNRAASNGLNLDAEQYVSMSAIIDIDVISRGPAARDRKEEVILALNSVYAQQQQETNSFYVGKISQSSGFINLSDVDGAAIPYRYKISVAMQYVFKKTKQSQSFNDFDFDTTIDP
jgi:hypothetical protein